MNSIKFECVTDSIEKYLANHKNMVVAIDGRCGAGKTYLSKHLEDIFECNVIHIDDFFLPFELRTEKRMSEVGGNIHTERFLKEVINPLMCNDIVSYRPYICKTGEFSDEISFKPDSLTVIEGTYSCLPDLAEFYDLKIFVDVSDEARKCRLKKRCDVKEYRNFENIWIPREEVYFKKCNTRELCDLVIDTSDFDKET